MEENDFWARLEFRICAEFRAFKDKQLRRNWCGGLVAEEYDPLSPQPFVRCRTWSGPDGQESWVFRLLVDPNIRSRADIKLVGFAS
jgi:hypothetical protein